MTRRNDLLKGMTITASMALLILDTKTALTGAKIGLDLCIQTVIPSLFPFFLLSILLVGNMTGVKTRFLHPICRIFRVPEGSEMLMLTGVLGGYPVGAQCVSQVFEQGQLSEHDARRMLAFCSNCGPAFLFGMVGAVFENIWVPWLLWAIHLFSAFLVSRIIPAGNNLPVNTQRKIGVTLPQALNSAIKVAASVCGWVIVFRIIIQFLQHWFLWMAPVPVQVAVSGLLELSNGCIGLGRIENTGLRLILCSGFLGFGGLCVTMQTYSIISPLLDRKMYFPGKLLQTSISLILAGIIQLSFPVHAEILHLLWFPLILGIISAIILRKLQNNSSIRRPVSV